MAQLGLARKQDITSLTALWQTCFGDSREFVSTFFSATRPQVFVAREGGSVVSMVCALSTSLVDEAGESCPAAYLYAVCTAPAFRGRGLCHALIAHAENRLRSAGCAFTVLTPAGDALFAFYEKMGYSAVFYHHTYEIPAREGTAKITAVSPDGYRNLRESQFYSAFLSYPLSLLRWQQHCGEATGGGLFRLETAEIVCCAAAEKQKDTLILKELLPDCPEGAAQLAATLGCSCAQVRTVGITRPFAMGKALTAVPLPEQAYLGLAFD